MTRVLITGGAGFIGSALIRHLMAATDWQILNLDALTYAADLQSLAPFAGSNRYRLFEGDITDRAAVDQAFALADPDLVMHLAAESHVDRSIDGPGAFIQTNILGTFTLLQAARAWMDRLSPERRQGFRFHHISTDEVFGSLGPEGRFSETTPYDPRSPYSASKAASDHLVRAWHHTYGLPVLLTNCSNNYGPWQFPEKLIPLMIIKGIESQPLPVYGDGSNIRDWIQVEDHAEALHLAASRGRIGETYVIGAEQEVRNLDIVQGICDRLDRLRPRTDGSSHRDLIRFVTDRPGHDQRYAIDPTKTRTELGWTPRHDIRSGLDLTVAWYLQNEPWWRGIQARRYAGERLGVTAG